MVQVSLIWSGDNKRGLISCLFVCLFNIYLCTYFSVEHCLGCISAGCVLSSSNPYTFVQKQPKRNKYDCFKTPVKKISWNWTSPKKLGHQFLNLSSLKITQEIISPTGESRYFLWHHHFMWHQCFLFWKAVISIAHKFRLTEMFLLWVEVDNKVISFML